MMEGRYKRGRVLARIMLDGTCRQRYPDSVRGVSGAQHEPLTDEENGNRQGVVRRREFQIALHTGSLCISDVVAIEIFACSATSTLHVKVLSLQLRRYCIVSW